MPRAKKKERSLDLYEHIAALNSVEECCRFFRRSVRGDRAPRHGAAV